MQWQTIMNIPIPMPTISMKNTNRAKNKNQEIKLNDFYIFLGIKYPINKIAMIKTL